MTENKNSSFENFSAVKTDFFNEKKILLNSQKDLNRRAKECLNKKNSKEAFEYFKKAGNIIACGYCKFLEGDLKRAESLLNLEKDSTPFGNWLIFLTGITEDKYPQTTYFQVRNFYEQDLEMLFFYERNDFIKKIIEKNPYIEKFNREIYKYTARVLLNNNIFDEAEKMLLKSCEICYNDPETHYMKGEIEINRGNIPAAIKDFRTSAEITGNYKPALEQLKRLTNKKEA